MAKSGTDAEFNSALDWIYQQKDEIERALYGKNQESVKAAIEEQTHKQATVQNYGKRVEEILQKTEDEEEKARLKDAYDTLVEIAEKKVNCLNTMLEITSLEDACANLSIQFDTNAVSMISKDKPGHGEGGDRIQGFVAPSSQDCVFAARDNWRWISRLVTCISTHLENASAYQQFFHEIDESETWMEQDLQKLNDKFHTDRQLKGDYDNAKRILEELQELVVSLRQWETKVNFMWEQGVKIVPVHLRTQAVQEPTPIRSLVDYETKNISVRENEDLLLLVNSDSKQWTVRNSRGQEASLPSLICLIPGPYKDAADNAIRMRLKLLTAWTTALKRVGKKLITFMLLVFKAEYNDDEIKIMRSIRLMDKRDLLRILDYIEDTLKVHWSDSRGFQLLQERVLALRMILNEGGEHPFGDEDAYKALVVQVQMLEKLMEKYIDLWKQWETFKCEVETSQHPELMLIVDKWQDLQFVDKDKFKKFWQMELTVDDHDALDGSGRGAYDSLEAMMNEGRLGQVAGVGVVETEVGLGSAPGMHGGRGPGGGGGYGAGGRGGMDGDYDEGMDGEGVDVRRGRGPGGVRGRPGGKGGDDDGDYDDDMEGRGGRHGRGGDDGDDDVSGRRHGAGGGDSDGEGGGRGRRGKGGAGGGGSSDEEGGRRGGPGGVGDEDGSGRGGRRGGPGGGDDGGGEGGPGGRHGRGGPGDEGGVDGEGMDGAGVRLTGRRKGSRGRPGDEGSDGVGGDGTGGPGRKGSRGGPGGEGMDGVGSGRKGSRGGPGGVDDGGADGSGRRGSRGRHGGPGGDGGLNGMGGGVDGRSHGGRGSMSNAGYGMEEQMIQAETVGYVGSGVSALAQTAQMRAGGDGSEFGFASDTRTAVTEQLDRAYGGEQRIFIIRSVVDPRDNNEISLQDAIEIGIINPDTGNYVNPDTNENTPIPIAMQQGNINVSFTTTKREKEQKTSIGIITVKTIREQASQYEFKSVKDTQTDRTISHEEAVNNSIIDETNGVYRDMKNKKEMLISDAIERGFVEAELKGEQVEPEVDSRAYAVRAVVDRRQKKIITFQEAVRRGIIDKETGGYKDTMTGEMMYVGDAIMKGFLKARKIEEEETRSLDVDPENKMVVDKTEALKRKLLAPLGVISAFKRAAQAKADE